MRVINLIKDNILIVFILLLSAFLRLYRLDMLMPFIPDQGWFYLSARDMILTGNIPLVGPPTSHPWIHHGPLWTYVLAVILWIFNFNPVPPAYFIAILGMMTVWLLYKVASEMFSKRVGLIAAFLFATSPFVVLNARIPYHTSPIPFFVILLFFSTFKLIKGKARIFPLITFLLGVLYNHEITTFVFFIVVGIVLGYGLVKKERWFNKLLNSKIILASIVSFIIPMIPFILYDISHGYKQTLGFLIWVLWRVVKLPLSFIDRSFASPSSSPSTLQEFFSYYQHLVFASSDMVSFIILILIAIFVIWYIYHRHSGKRSQVPDGTWRSASRISKGLKRFWTSQNDGREMALLFLFLSVALVGLFVHRIPIEADTLIISPFIIVLISLSILWITRNKFLLVIVIVTIISALNVYFLFSTNFLTTSTNGGRIAFSERLEAINNVLLLSSGKPYKIVGRGPLSNFPVFTMPYEYLLWWKGHPPTKEDIDLKIIVWEKDGEIIVYEEE